MGKVTKKSELELWWK